MTDEISLGLSRDEALVLFEFFARFEDDDGEFVLRHNAESIAFSRISAQLDKALVEPIQPEYQALLQVARDRVAAGYEGLAPGVVENKA